MIGLRFGTLQQVQSLVLGDSVKVLCLVIRRCWNFQAFDSFKRSFVTLRKKISGVCIQMSGIIMSMCEVHNNMLGYF